MAVQISEQLLGRILAPLGYPIVSLEDMTKNWESMSREQFEDQLLYPALNDYFTFFPTPLHCDYPVTGKFKIKFPELEDEWDSIYGLTDSRLISEPDIMHNWENPFMHGIAFWNSKAQGMPSLNADLYGGFMQVRSAFQGIRETFQSVHCKIDWNGGLIRGYTNLAGRLAVTWAVGSRSYDRVRYDLIPDIVRLAQGYVLDFFGSLEQRSTAGLPTELGGERLVDKANKYREDILEKWAAMPKPVMLR